MGVEGDPFPPQDAAAYFHLYGIRHDDVDYILEIFPLVKCRYEQAHGAYRTKRVILDIYDAMQQAMEAVTLYHTRLDPPACIRLDPAGNPARGSDRATE